MIAPKKNPPKPHTFNYQLKVTLIHSKPSIWRRFHVPDNLKLSRLDGVLQVVMGWTDSHLHQFRVGHDLYSLPRDGDFADSDYRDESRYTLADIAVCDKDKFIYEYDAHQKTAEASQDTCIWLMQSPIQRLNDIMKSWSGWVMDLSRNILIWSR